MRGNAGAGESPLWRREETRCCTLTARSFGETEAVGNIVDGRWSREGLLGKTD